MNENVKTRPYVYLVEYYDYGSDDPRRIGGVFDTLEKAQKYFDDVKSKVILGICESLHLRKVPLNVGAVLEDGETSLWFPEIGSVVCEARGGQ